MANPNQNHKVTREPGSGRGGTWLIIIIILVLIAILWPILRRDSSDDEATVSPETTATTTEDGELTTDIDIDTEATTPQTTSLTPPPASSVTNPSTPTTAPASTASNTMALRVFFGNNRVESQGFRCDVVYPVVRVVPRSPAVARAALNELLRGPLATEQAAGMFTSINQGVKIQSLTIAGGVARVDLSDELAEGVAGSCLTTAIRAQITETLKQFPTVNSVIISIDGQTEEILQP